ncbi:anti-sigma factor [Tenacibaculum soleae]|uniref:anti-sigma factor n=1 Tax=Tenacibaculum soleae TaxID=447689 RepID=UPI0023008EFD|nr:anti-sigma factor [Tenacibaculum soleae]
MEAKKHIESGILELYVAGALSEKENEQIHALIIKYPEILKEIKDIEKSISSLTGYVSRSGNKNSFKNILIKILQEKENSSKIIPLNSRKNNWATYTGWAAALIIGSTLVLSINKNNNLQAEIDTINQAKDQFKFQLEKSNTFLAQNENLLKVIRAKNVVTVPLQGQKVLPEAYAKVFWNKESQKIYLDVQGLPDPPKGKVYQVWSLKLDPLLPTSLGTIDNFITNKNKIFTIDNPNESQAFGITLEPTGGSISPNLEQLYTLGAV